MHRLLRAIAIAILPLTLLRRIEAAVDTSYKECKFRTKLDHFAFHNNKTFEIRYMLADQYWDHSGGPIFFYTGNEDEVENFVVNTGIMWDWAPEFKALVVFAEHRYYGQSLPFGDESFDSPNNLGYLSSEQALADYADLILHLKFTLPGAEKSSVVAFGGSYGGMLAAWFRLKYPHIVSAALSGSAPINMSPGLVPCERFNEAVTAAYDRESQLCSAAIRRSWTVLQNLGYTAAGCERLRKTFKLCHSLSPSNYTLLRHWIKETYSTLAMANFPEPADLVGALPANPVKTCNELMTATCANGVTDMFFPYTWNASAERERCQEEFGISPDFYRTVMLYGGDSFETASKIIFSNGELDPWAALGVLEAPNENVLVLLIPDAAHHVDMRFARPGDAPSIVRARDIEKRYIREWIEGPESRLAVTKLTGRKKKHWKKALLPGFV